MSAILTVFKLEERAYEGVFAPLPLFANLERKMKIFFGEKKQAEGDPESILFRWFLTE